MLKSLGNGGARLHSARPASRAAEDGGAGHEDITAEIGEDDAAVLRARGDSDHLSPALSCAKLLRVK